MKHNSLTFLFLNRYMSKAPGAAPDYDGSGLWFKIYDWGPTFGSTQATWDLSSEFIFALL